jgi:hypothetical protein
VPRVGNASRFSKSFSEVIEMIPDLCRNRIAALSLVLCGLWAAPILANETSRAEQPAADAIPAAHLLRPADLAQRLTSPGAEKPLILQVGSRVLFSEAHIPGSEYVGAAGQEAGLHALEDRVKKLDRSRLVVIYCGCCPWPKCPNIRRAYERLVDMGFTRVQVLYIAENFGTDWVDKGFPIAKGEP